MFPMSGFRAYFDFGSAAAEPRAITLSVEESNHLCGSLRAAEGDEADAFDLRGNIFKCRIARADKKRAQLEIIRRVPPAPRNVEISLVQCLPKGRTFDDIIRQCVEIGAARVYPAVSQFCQSRPDAALFSMAWFLGLITLISGVAELIAVLNAQRIIPNSGTRVLSAILQIVIGCILLSNKMLVTVSLPIIFAVWVLVEGIIIIVKSFDYKQVDFKYWWCILILGICGAVLGLLGLRNPDAAGKTLSILVGIGVISEGISYLVTLRGINRFEKKVTAVRGAIREALADDQQE